MCGVCGHKHPATPEGWVAPHASKRSGEDCPGGRLSLAESELPKQDRLPVPSEDYKHGSSSVRTVSVACLDCAAGRSSPSSCAAGASHRRETTYLIASDPRRRCGVLCRR